MNKKKAYFLRWRRRIILFLLAFFVSIVILLVLPLYQYFSGGGNRNNSAATISNVRTVKVNLEKPAPKKKLLKVKSSKPELSRNSDSLERFNLNLDAAGSAGMGIASEDVEGLEYDSGNVDELPVRLRGRDPVVPDSFYASGLPGSVELELVVEANGEVSRVVVLYEDPVGFGLGQSCADAVRSWTFRSAKVQGVDVRIRVVQPFRF